MQAAINITPLVDVVLVLLIIFMVMAPQMRNGTGGRPAGHGEAARAGRRARPDPRHDRRGGRAVDRRSARSPPSSFGEGLRAAAGAEPDRKVVIRGDARLRFGDVRQAMIAIEEAGFDGVGLIADSAARTTGGE